MLEDGEDGKKRRTFVYRVVYLMRVCELRGVTMARDGTARWRRDWDGAVMVNCVVTLDIGLHKVLEC
jgi:hypothetical protein